jgi:peroxiredoxin
MRATWNRKFPFLRVATATLLLALAAPPALSMPAAGDPAAAPVPQPPALGAPAPAFTLAALDGAPVCLDSLRGRPVVLEWINVDCPFVKNQYDSTGNLPRLQREFRARGVTWLTICSSAPGKQGHMEPATLRGRLVGNGWAADAYLLDADGATGRAYGARTTPHMFVLDAQGRLVYDGAIDNEPGTRPESVAKAVNFVAPVLRALLDGQPVEPRRTKPYGCSVKY